jgi:UDP-N-acetylmuramyl pentapeptide phosphotransferase/UDP-N-acetylglucosamine-1-phosphate transferase
MIYILFAFMSSLAIAFLFMPLLINILQKENVFDEGGLRKIHKGLVPTMGGIVILIAFTFSLLAWLPSNPFFSRKFLLGAIFLIALLGIRDDFDPVLPKQKLVVQFIAAGIIVFLADVRFASFYGFLGIEVLPYWLSYIITILFIIFITNAFNLIDGIDGLAGLMGAISLGLFGVWFYFAGYPEYSIVAIALMGGILGFLYYNWYPASIFMGDTGSLIIGFTLSICSIWFINLNASLPSEKLIHFNAPLCLTLGVLLLPIFDTFRVSILRIRQRVSPFKPDKQHTHHQVLRMSTGHGKATLTIALAYIFVLTIIIVLGKILSDNVLMPLILISCILLDFFLKNRRYRFIMKKYGRVK